MKNKLLKRMSACALAAIVGLSGHTGLTAHAEESAEAPAAEAALETSESGISSDAAGTAGEGIAAEAENGNIAASENGSLLAAEDGSRTTSEEGNPVPPEGGISTAAENTGAETAGGNTAGDVIIANDASGIPDSVLYGCLVEQGDGLYGNNDGMLTVAEAESITYISLDSNAIQDYTGLHFASEVTSISLWSDSSEEDYWEAAADSFLTELSGLDRLETINGIRVLSEDMLTTLTQKNSLTALELRVYETIEDYRVLAQLPLTSLSVSGYDIPGSKEADFTFITNETFPDLTSLQVAGFCLPEMPEGIGTLAALSNLNWNDNQTRRLADLQALEGLNYLYLYNNCLLEEEIQTRVPEKFSSDASWMEGTVNPYYDPETDEYYEENRAIIRNDASGIPDSVLYAAALRAGDEYSGNQDGVLTVAEARKISSLNIHYSVRDYTGLAAWLDRLNYISFTWYYGEDSVGADNESHWEEAADSFFAEYANLAGVTSIYNIKILNDEMLTVLAGNTSLVELGMEAESALTNWSVLGGGNLISLSVSGICPMPQELPENLVNGLTQLTLNSWSSGDGEGKSYEFRNFANLESLSLSGNIAAVTGLESLNLRYLLYVHNDGSTDGEKAVIGTLPTSLESLHLNNCMVPNIMETAIPQMQNLNVLELKDAGLESLAGVEGLTQLHHLSVAGNAITDLTPVSGLTELWYLSVDNNAITDLTPVSGLTGLSTLYAANNKIENISCLENLSELTVLRLEYNNIADVTVVSQLPQLQELQLSNNKIAALPDLTGLAHLGEGYLDKLYAFNLSGNLLTKEAVAGYVPEPYNSNLLWLTKAVSCNVNGWMCYGSLNSNELRALIFENNPDGANFYSMIMVREDARVELAEGLLEVLIEDGITLDIQFVDQNGHEISEYCVGGNYPRPVSGNLVLSNTLDRNISSEDKAAAEALFAQYEEMPTLYYFQYEEAVAKANIAMTHHLLVENAVAYALYFYDYETDAAVFVSNAYSAAYPIGTDESGEVVYRNYLYLSNYTEQWNYEEEKWQYIMMENGSCPSSKGFYFLVAAEYIPTNSGTAPDVSPEPDSSPAPDVSPEPDSSPAPDVSPEPVPSPEGPVNPGESNPMVIEGVNRAEEAEDILLDKIRHEYRGRASIAIDSATTLSKNVFQEMMNYNKGLSVAVTNEKNEKMYEWSFDSSQLDPDKFVDLDLTVKFETEAQERIEELTGQSNAFYMSFNHHGDLPAPATMTVYVGSQYQNGDIVYLYYYNEDTQKVEAINGSGHVVTDGYVTYMITHCSEYFLASATPEELGVEIVETGEEEEESPEEEEESTDEEAGTDEVGQFEQTKPVKSPKTGDTNGEGAIVTTGEIMIMILAIGAVCAVMLYKKKKD